MSTKKNTLSEVKKVYTSSADEVQRGFYSYLRRLQKDAAAAEADKRTQCAALAAKEAAEAAQKAQKRAQDMQRAAKKDAAKQPEAEAAKQEAQEAKQRSEAARKQQQEAQKAAQEAKKASAADAVRAEAVAALAEVMQRKGLKAEDFTKDFLQKYLPDFFNTSGRYCKRKEVKLEEAEEVRKQYADTPEVLQEAEEKLYLLIEVKYFTANSLLSVFTKAADKRSAQQKEAEDKRSEAEKAAEKAKKEEAKRKKYAEMLRKAQEFFAQEEAQKAEAKQ